MTDLSFEIERFFKWAKISAEQFAQGKGPDFIVQAEWTDEYPYIDDLYKSMPSAIEKLNNNWDDSLAEQLLLAIAIDDEDSVIISYLSEGLNDLMKFTEFGYKNNNPRTKLGIIDLLYDNDLPNRELILTHLRNDPHQWVSTYAKLERNK